MITPSSANALYIRTLADLLVACPVGGIVTYHQMTAAVGEDVEARRYLVVRALTVANTETGANFRCIRQTGYQRMTSEEAHTVGGLARVVIRRKATRAARAIGNAVAKANDMSNAAMLQAFSEQAQLGLIQHMTYERNMPQPREGEPPPNVAKTVAASVKALRDHLTARRG